MISPVGIVDYVRAEQRINQAYTNVLDKLRPEFFTITQIDKEISINFTLLDNGTNPRITAIYGDGVSEPEVYVNRNDWDNFNPLEFSDSNFPSNDILLDTIKYEFRKDMQHFFNILKVSGNFLDLFLFKCENSTIQRVGDHGLKISFLLDGFDVQFEFESTKGTRLSVKKFNENGFPPLTENIDLNADFDPITAANRPIEKVKGALHLADKLIQRLSQVFRFKALENFPHGELLINETVVKGK
ncbi:unnamed protein product [Hymenolepis diminuta]|uniref:Uncharacterized protein n=1 Tax=Hymenolepis diminuta TaxID=6216 RepID=A0A564Z8X3_HYMDI|nr:unnamed protein product [Hymenolepis diminuta]